MKTLGPCRWSGRSPVPRPKVRSLPDQSLCLSYPGPWTLDLFNRKGAKPPSFLKGKDTAMNDTFKLCPIGVIRKRGRAHHVVVSDRFVDGLLGLEGFSHAILLCVVPGETATRSLFEVQHPRVSIPPEWTRKTRSRACSRPVRLKPNPIAWEIFRIPDPRPERQSKSRSTRSTPSTALR